MLAELVAEEYPNIPIIAVMPCTAKKDECLRKQLGGEISGAITVVELLQECKDKNIDIEGMSLSDCYDKPFFECSGGAYIFGMTGGVGANVLRQLCLVKDIEKPQLIDEFVHWQDKSQHVQIRRYMIGEEMFVLAVAAGGTAMEKVCELVESKTIDIDVVEQMACPYGCMNGGGMPKVRSLADRKEGMERLDESTIMKVAGQNPATSVLKIDEKRFCTFF